ncbi:hypothetical protein [Kordia sp.]|uniref:hypothetical protein n=1 Tax=Kordia sp. TaxID=1965332 RepID=UPI003D28FE41
MSKKVFLIAVFIISLLLIGLMMLIADAGNNPILNNFTTIHKEFEEANKSFDDDSLQKQIETSDVKYPAIVAQFNTKALELLHYIEVLKKDFTVAGDDFKKMEVHKNQILFIKNTNEHSEKGKQFIAKIEAYENALAIVRVEFPKINTHTSQKLRDNKENTDWLTYNFKDFTAIASYTRLAAMEVTIKSKQKDIFMLVLNTK